MSVNDWYSLGSVRDFLVTTTSRSVSFPISLNNSSNFSGEAFICLNKLEILVPFLLQTQQCQGL